MFVGSPVGSVCTVSVSVGSFGISVSSVGNRVCFVGHLLVLWPCMHTCMCFMSNVTRVSCCAPACVCVYLSVTSSVRELGACWDTFPRDDRVIVQSLADETQCGGGERSEPWFEKLETVARGHMIQALELRLRVCVSKILV